MASTFADLWNELKAEAHAAIAAAKAELATIEHNIVPIIEADVAAVLSQLKGLAIQSVLAFAKAEFDNLAGHEKQSLVVTRVYQAAEAAGKSLAIQDARMLAQQAYDAVAGALAPK